MGEQTDASDVDLGGQTIRGTAARVATMVIAFVGTILFARLLGPAGYGGFYLLLAIVEIADRPVRGWGRAGKKRFSEASTVEEEVFGAVLVVLVIASGFIVIIAVAFAAPLRAYTGIEAAPMLLVLLFGSTMLYVSVRSIVEARGLMSPATWSNTLRNWLAFPIQLVLVLTGFGAAGMAYGYATATVLAVPAVVYYVGVRPVFPSRETVSNLWTYAKYSIPNSFLGKAYSRADLLLLGVLLTPDVAGYYEAAYRVSMPATFVASIAGGVLMARVSNLRSKGESVSGDVGSILSVSSVLSIPFLFGAVVIAEPVVVILFGADYAAAAPLLIGLGVYRVVKSQTQPLIDVVDGLDRPDVNLRLSAVTIGINVALGIPLILAVGPIGVVIATVIAETIRYVGLVRFVGGELSDLTLFPRPLLAQVFSGGCMALVVVLTTRFVSVDTWYVLGGVVVGGAAVYGIVLLASSAEIRSWTLQQIERRRNSR